MFHRLRVKFFQFTLISLLIFTTSACSKIFPQSKSTEVILGAGGSGSGSPGGGGTSGAGGSGSGNNGGNNGGNIPGGGGSLPGAGGVQPIGVPAPGGFGGGGYIIGSPAPGTGVSGILLQNLFYDPQLGIQFECVKDECFIEREVKKNANQEIISFGISVFSKAGLAQRQPFFSFYRVFEVNGERLGKVASAQLIPLVKRFFSQREWELNQKLNGIESAYTTYKENQKHKEEFFSVDDSEGLAHTVFSFSPNQTDDAVFGYKILFSILIDLKAPVLQQIYFQNDRLRQGEWLELKVVAEDDLTGVNPYWSYQENPEAWMNEIEPKKLFSWLGLNIRHSKEKYSSAYAFPFAKSVDSYISYDANNPNQFSFFKRIPYFLNIAVSNNEGNLVLGGIQVMDNYGHKTILSAEEKNTNNNEAYFKERYEILAGTIDVNSDTLLHLKEIGVSNTSNSEGSSLQLSKIEVKTPSIITPNDTLKFDLTISGRIYLRRIILSYTTDGASTLNIPVGCLDSSSATLNYNGLAVENHSLHLEMKNCFSATGASLLPVNKPIFISKVVLYDDYGQRSEYPNPSNPVEMPSFTIIK